MESSQSTFDTAIIGAGIVGSALAYFLSNSPENGTRVALIDRTFTRLRGSTAYAPGFVGQFNESDVLTRLAIDSVSEYSKVPGGIDIVGGLEVATTPSGVSRLQSRHDIAKKAGLAVELISPQRAVQMAPDLVKDDILIALHFANDGAANPTAIASFYQREARENGVTFIEADIEQIQIIDGHVTGALTAAGLIQAKRVIVATGIWTKELCSFGIPIPIIPVAHPYMYGQQRESKPYKAPWVRWPEYHVYARDHGNFYGMGSYDHHPIPEEPKETARGDWKEQFDATLEKARSLVPAPTELIPSEKFNGIFAMTPDNMPLVGSINAISGLYMAAAVWITHAAGAAKFMAKLLNGETVDENMTERLDPTRFQGKEIEILKQESLDAYNDVYKTDGDKSQWLH